MSRRRDMAPTLERRDGQIQTMGRQLAKAQALARDLKRQVRAAQDGERTVLEELRHSQARIAAAYAEATGLKELLRELQHDHERHEGAEADRPLQHVDVPRDAGEHRRGLERVLVQAAGNLSGFVRRHVGRITRWRSLW